MKVEVNTPTCLVISGNGDDIDSPEKRERIAGFVTGKPGNRFVEYARAGRFETASRDTTVYPQPTAAEQTAFEDAFTRGVVGDSAVPVPRTPYPKPDSRRRAERRLAALEQFALAQMKSRAAYNGVVKRESESRDVSEFPEYKLQPNRKTRRQIRALRKKLAK